jgi:uncharacterized protein YukE
MDYTLKVQPDVFVAKGTELNAVKTEVAGIMEQAKNDITSLNSVWIAEAADEYQSRFRQIYNDIDNMLGIVTGYIGNFEELGALFVQMQEKAKNDIIGLPTDGVLKV